MVMHAFVAIWGIIRREGDVCAIRIKTQIWANLKN